MKETEFTPGPWSYAFPRSKFTDYEDWGTVRGADGRPVARVSTAGINADDLDACRRSETDPVAGDAHLIAAAPDMFKALQEIVEKSELHAHTNNMNPHFRPLYEQARAALSKARGIDTTED